LSFFNVFVSFDHFEIHSQYKAFMQKMPFLGKVLKWAKNPFFYGPKMSHFCPEWGVKGSGHRFWSFLVILEVREVGFGRSDLDQI